MDSQEASKMIPTYSSDVIYDVPNIYLDSSPVTRTGTEIGIVSDQVVSCKITVVVPPFFKRDDLHFDLYQAEQTANLYEAVGEKLNISESFFTLYQKTESGSKKLGYNKMLLDLMSINKELKC